ncbi:MAG: transcription elongation factor GreA [Acidimicrobiia bacterium]|nr:transcription elongation factor GreA [Acidimicrobiia bacterium]MYJ13204.1 transcription elongation factor GreA [Acidimicrobiia bacterium]
MRAPQLTRVAYERLQEELAHLTGPANAAITAQIAAARALGDLSENGDYHAAREEKGKMQGRILQIQALLEKAVVVSRDEHPDDVVNVGSLVDLRFGDDEDTERYLIGSIEERHDAYDVVSPSSPLGVAMIGARAGDVVSYAAPAGQVEVTVVAVEAAEDRH